MKSTRSYCVAAACALSLSVAPAASAGAPAPTPGKPADHAVVVEVDASALTSIAEDLEQRLVTDVDRTLLEDGMHPAGDGKAHLRIEVKPDGASKINFLYTIRCDIDGRDVPKARVDGTCPRCVPEDIVAKVAQSLPASLAALRHDLEPEPAAVPTPRASDSAQRSNEVGQVDERRGRGPRGVAGIVVGSVGLVGLVVGVALYVRPIKFHDRPDAQWERGRDAKVAGIVAMAAGGAAIVVALPLYFTDPKRNRKLSVAPGVGRGAASVTMGMRF